VNSLLPRLQIGLKRRWLHTHSNRRLARLEAAVTRAAPTSASADERPVVFFNASTRILGMSLNAGFQTAAAWALRMRGVPVIHFACQAGLSRCVLGAALNGPQALPPCSGCIAQSRAAFPSSRVHWFIYRPDPALQAALAAADQPLAALEEFTWQGMPLGALCLPALRWTLRRHHLVDDAETRDLFCHYILSAWRVAQKFGALLEQEHPRAVVVFNGMFFPEAAARWVARERFHLPVISHEVGLRPMTAFFTPGDATAYPIQIPDSFQLTPEQDARLNVYLEQRLKGNFTMAGIRFWPEMRGLDEGFLRKLAGFKQLVPVFTNVIFDTSQPHSNVVFPHMFAWLDQVLETAREHPATLFVIRAHPDETRPGKSARENVAAWALEKQVDRLPNVHFVPSDEYFSSYELIQRARFVMVYNSTIGLEASLMGAAVLCAGKARFTQLPTVFFPQTPAEYRRLSAEFLAAERIDIPAEFSRNARRFLYYQLYKTSLPFDAWLEEDGVWPGYVRFKNLDAAAFDPANTPILRIIADGILTASPFVLEN
jgi:hypothetical protein